MAYYDTEELSRSIGQLQANAMSNLWSAGNSRGLEPGAGIGGPGAMLEPSLGMGGGGSAMLELGPFGQGMAGQMLQPDLSLNADSSGATAMRDLNDFRNSTERGAALAEAAKARKIQEAFARGDKLSADRPATRQVIPGMGPKSPGFAADDPTVSPSSSTSGSGNSVYAGAFPHANMIQGYLPDDLKDDAELMRIIAAGSHAESGWDVNRIQNGYSLGSGKGARGLFQFDMGGMGKPYLGNEGALLGEAGAKLQASQIVPLYVDWYRRRASSGLSDPAEIASWVAAHAERPYQYENQASAARRHYAASYGKVGQAPTNPAPANSGAPYQVNRTSQFGLGLSKSEADAFCGPAAALALAQHYGNNIPVEKVREYAIQGGWSVKGQAGPQAQVNLLNKLGVPSQMAAWDEARAQQIIASGTPVTIDTPGHYYIADAYDPAKGYRVGTSGTDLVGGGAWMTPAQMRALKVSGAPRTMIWKS